MRTLGTLVLSSRPLSWINTAFPFGLAYYVLTERVDQVLVVGFVFFLIPYNLLMYGINDVFDYESDLRNPRKGGVEGALLPPALHRITLITSVLVPLPFLVLLVMWGSFSASAVLALSLFFVIAYSAKGVRFKEIPFLDSMTSSAHFVMPAVYAIVFVGEGVSSLDFSSWPPSSSGGWHHTRLAQCKTSLLIGRRAWGPLPRWSEPRAPCVLLRCFMSWLVGRLLVTPWPLPLIAPVALLYLATISPWWNVSDEAAEEANRGWKWFLLLNFVAGAVVVLVLFEWWQVNP